VTQTVLCKRTTYVVMRCVRCRVLCHGSVDDDRGRIERCDIIRSRNTAEVSTEQCVRESDRDSDTPTARNAPAVGQGDVLYFVDRIPLQSKTSIQNDVT